MISNFFTPNIDKRGRIARLIFGLLEVVAAIFLWRYSWWLGALLALFALFSFYEAFRGWCILRACGIKTKY
jgi:hypothetical protein